MKELHKQLLRSLLVCVHERMKQIRKLSYLLIKASLLEGFPPAPLLPIKTYPRTIQVHL